MFVLNTAAAQPGTEIFNLPAVTTSGKIQKTRTVAVSPANRHCVMAACQEHHLVGVGVGGTRRQSQ